MASKKPENLKIGCLEFSFEVETRRVWVRDTYYGNLASFEVWHLADLDYWVTAVRDYEPPYVPEVGEAFSFCGSHFMYVRLKLNPDEMKANDGRFKCLRTTDDVVVWISPDKKFQRVDDEK